MLTKNIIPRKEAVKLAPLYVKFVESLKGFEAVDKKFRTLKKGQSVLTCLNGVYVKCKVTSVDKTCIQAVDGPVVRVGNGEQTWRVDGCDWAWPI